MSLLRFLDVADDLEVAGLLWNPEIGDEVTDRSKRDLVSVFVDSKGLTPSELRSAYLWLPSVEQMVQQFEARQAILYHAGLELTTNSVCYKTVIQSPIGHIETRAESLRLAIGFALRDLLLTGNTSMH